MFSHETVPDIAPQQADGLLRNRATILTNLVVALLAILVLQETLPAATTLAWIAGMAALNTARLFLSHWLRKSAWPARRKLHVFTAGAVLSGLSWGCLPVLLLPVGGVEDFAFAGFMIAGMTAGAITALCWYQPAYLGYLLGATLPLAACLLLLKQPVYLAMAWRRRQGRWRPGRRRAACCRCAGARAAPRAHPACRRGASRTVP